MFTNHHITRQAEWRSRPWWRLLVLVTLMLGGLATPLAVGAEAPQPPSNLRAPASPVRVHATADAGAAVLDWGAPYNNGSPITAYTVQAYSPDINGHIVGTRDVPGNTTTLRWLGIDRPFLQQGVSYVFTVTASNAFGAGNASTPSNSVTWAPGISAPAQPQNVRAVAADGAATLTWDAPADGGTPILGYEITILRGPNRDRSDWREAGNTPEVTVDGLDNGVIYSFIVQAVNAAGWSAPSNPSNSVIAGTSVPAAPSNVQATAGNNSATVSWSVPYNGGSAITGYVIRTYAGATGGAIADTFAGGNATSAVIAGLGAGTAYSFTVFAVNGSGWSAESARSNPVTIATIPDAPVNVHVDIGIGSAVVHWAPGASDGGSALTGYTVTAFQGNTATVARVVTVDHTQTAANVNLASGGTYTFAVQAANAVGLSALSTRSDAVTLPAAPGAPRNLAATADDTSAHVRWDAPAQDGGMPVDHYRVTASDGVHPPVTLTSTDTSATITGLVNGATYTVTVVAINKVGEGSAASTSVTLQNLPPTLTVPGSESGHYGDSVSFDISANDAESSDHITLAASNLPAGLSFTDHGNGTGSVSGNLEAPAGTYTLTFSANDGHNAPVSQTLTLAVGAQSAIITPSARNPLTVRVAKAGGGSRSITLQATIAQAASAHGDLTHVGSVTYTLTGLDSGDTYSCTAQPSGSTGATQCRFRNLPVDAYEVQISLDNSYYSGEADAALSVYGATKGAVSASGAVDGGDTASPLNLQAAFDRAGHLRGGLSFTSHGAGGDLQLKSTGLQSLVIIEGRAYIQGRATVNGKGNYTFLAVLDHDDGDQFGLWVGDEHNATVADLTFDSLDLTSGGIKIRA